MKTYQKNSVADNRGKSDKISNPKRRASRGKRVRPLAPRQFLDIIEHMNDGVVVLDRDWRYIYVNQKAAVMLQREKSSDLIGKHIWTEYPEGIGQPFHLAYEKAMREQTPIVFEEHYEPWDLWFENRIYPSPDRLLILFTEITERKRTEQLLEERQHLLQKILDTEPGTVYIYDLEERRNVYVNRHWLSTFGYTPEETQAMGDELLTIIIHPDDISLIAEHHANWRQVSEGKIRTLQYRVRSKAGEWRWLYSREAPFTRDESGEVRQILGIAHDVTDRLRMQQAVLKEKDLSNAILDSLPGIFYLYDRTGNSLRWNKNLEIISGYTAEEILQMHPLDFFQEREREYLAEREKEVFVRGSSAAEANFTTKKGELLPYYFTGKRIEIDGQPYLIGMGIDITQRREVEEELRKLNLELEQRIAARTQELATAMTKAQESDRLKSAFLATMSHELRTPLNSIIGFTGVILRGLAGPLNDEQSKQLNMIQDSAHHLLALINDILDISKIEAGQLEIFKRPFDMRQAIESVLRLVQPLAYKKNLQLVASIGTNINTINNDRRRVEQVLINLVNNAIKFTERGQVRIECQIKDGWLETSVYDSGIGIKPEDMDRLFKPFHQIDTGLARGHEGTGLGLAICKRLVNLMDGEITVESEWGVGSTFKFTLPM